MKKQQEINEQIGARLRQLRLDKCLGLRLGYKIRMEYDVRLDPSRLGKMERGKVEIPVRTLCALADFFGVTPAFFFDEPGHLPGPVVEWVPVSERLPTSDEILAMDGNKLWVLIDGDIVTMSQCDIGSDGKWFPDFADGTTHWAFMRYPEPPK